MKHDEAWKVFSSWQQYLEVADKFKRMMLIPPQSFLPYPAEMLERACDVVAKEYFDKGDKQTATEIQRLMVLYLGPYFHPDGFSEEQALARMHKMLGLILGDAELRQTILRNLADSQQSWIDARQQR